MTFLEIVNAVLSDRFDEALRSDAKNWVNHRLAWIWVLEPWTYRYGTANVSVTAGSQAVTGLPSDLGPVRALMRSNGTRLRAMAPAEFYDTYYDATSSATGAPEAYTVVGSAIFVGPTSNETKADYRLVYEKEVTLLVGDNDVPGLPVGFHFALVHGGAAEGLKRENDPTFQAAEADFQASIAAMRQNYLEPHHDRRGQWGRRSAARF